MLILGIDPGKTGARVAWRSAGGTASHTLQKQSKKKKRLLIMADQMVSSGLRGKTEAEIEEMASSVKLSAADRIYVLVRNSFIEEAEIHALRMQKKGRAYEREFSAKMNELMHTKGIPLLRDAGLCK